MHREEQLTSEVESLNHNLQKIRFINKIYLIVLLSFIFIIYKVNIVSSFQFDRYFLHYSLTLLVITGYFYLFDIKKVAVSEKNQKQMRILVHFYVGFFLTLSALLPIINIHFYYSTLVYLFILFSCIPILVMKSKEIIMLLSITSLILLIGLGIQNDITLLQMFCILASVSISYFISRSFYNVYQSAQNFRKEKIQEVEQLQNLTEFLTEANKQLQLEATLDPLTNLYNRRAYNDYLTDIQQKFTEPSLSISIIMVDVDCFKLYNDTYGHSEGDNVLSVLGKLLHSISTEYDCFVSRFGGEEFVLILIDKPEDVVERICFKIREGVHELNIPHQSSIIDTVVTVSIGACTKSITNICQINDCMIEADAALYSVKENGRNSFEYRHHMHA